MMDETLRILIAVWAGAVGAIVGSFLNVVIARVPHGESVVRPRSRCPRCGAPIVWYDNVPVLSWIVLRARCRSCQARISWRYPLVELLGAAAALLAVERHGLTLPALAEFAFVAALIALAFIDLDTWLLPHAITWPLIAAGLLAAWAGAAAAPLRSVLWGAGVGFSAFALVSVVASRLLRREALGFGDVWLLAGIGAWLGLGALLPVVLLASLQGSVVGIALILLGRAQPGPPSSPEPGASPPVEPLAPSVLGEAQDAPGSQAATVEQGAQAPAPEQGGATHVAEDEDWIPPRNAVPFGPFLAAAALEWLYLAEPLARLAPQLRIFL
jgi:leader peptidase (prepilin peptidase)/N-methyltransferase